MPSPSPAKKGRRTPTHSESSSMEEIPAFKLPLGQFNVHCLLREDSSKSNRRPQPLRVHMNIEDMRAMRIAAGDWVFLSSSVNNSEEGEEEEDFTTKKRALGLAWPSMTIRPSNVDVGRLILDNCSTETRLIKDGNRIIIEKCSSANSSLTEAPLVRVQMGKNEYQSLGQDYSFLLYIKEILVDLEYGIDGQIIEFMYGGQLMRFSLNFKSSATPSLAEEYIDRLDIFRLVRNTKVHLEARDFSSPAKPTGEIEDLFEEIGGHSEQIKTISEMIRTPLLHPERFIKYGLAPPKGLLLYGPPGTGKTMIAKTIAFHMGVNVLLVNGPDLIDKSNGETESKLKEIFQEAAKRQPSIIILDEIDSLCPSRSDGVATDQQKRIVACLLTLMDGSDDRDLKDRPRIFVIGATNRPNAMDSALRRPGRFDREFEIGIPNAIARREILGVMLRKVGHNLSEVDLDLISGKAHGYVGADLASICREAGLCTINRLRQSARDKSQGDLSNQFQQMNLGNDVDDLTKITLDDMLKGMSLVRPSVVREILLEVPKVYWHEIGGQEEIKQKLKEAVEWPLKHPEVFVKFSIRPPKGLLLYGPPGCSKTLMAKALATEAGLNFLAVKGPELFSKWVGESEKAVQQIFKKARAASPSIIFFDEIDAIAVKRSSSSSGGSSSSVADRVLSQLLSEMDGIEPLVNVTIIAATNRPDILDSALLRPGRIDSILYVSPPDLASRTSIFQIQLRKIPHDPGSVDPGKLASLTEGFSGAETVAVCQNAAMLAMEASLDAEEVTMSQFVEAIRGTTKRITQDMLEFYDTFRNRSGLNSL